MKVRFKYRRWGVMKYIGHLDMMRYFQKAMRRADIDICYSEGFSPHQIMSFATPIGVGVTSDGEYFDIQANSMKSSAETIAAPNATMADGVEVMECVLLPDNAKNAMSLVAAADYRLSYKEGYESPLSITEWQELVRREFTVADQFMIIKKTKKSEREINLKPLVYRLTAESGMGVGDMAAINHMADAGPVAGADDGTDAGDELDTGGGSDDGDGLATGEMAGTYEQGEKPEFFLQLSAGSTDNIKPELVLAALYERTGLAYDPLAIQIHRIEVYAREEESGRLVPLSAFGKEIQ